MIFIVKAGYSLITIHGTMAHHPSKTTLTLAIIGGILAVSTASIFIRFAQSEAPSLVIAAYRLFFASLVLAPIAFIRNRAELLNLSRRELGLGLLSGIFLAMHFATWITSLEYTSVASSVVLVTTTPLWVALLSPLILREAISRPVIIGLVLSLAGGSVVGLSDACSWNGGLVCPSAGELLKGEAFLGNFLALLGAWMAAGYIIIGRRLRAKVSLIPYIFMVYGMAAIILVAAMLVAGKSPVGFSSEIYVWMLALALVPQLLGHSTFNWALKYLPASVVSVTLLGEPICSTILAYLFLSERPTAFKLVGAALILLGIYLSTLSDDKAIKAEALEILPQGD